MELTSTIVKESVMSSDDKMDKVCENIGATIAEGFVFTIVVFSVILFIPITLPLYIIGWSVRQFNSFSNGG